MEKNVWIVAARRTPLGSFQGQFSSLSSTELGRFAIQGVLEKSGLEPSQVDEVLMGCVLPAGCGQAPARQAALAAGIPDSVGCTTINKVCGSGMKSVMLAHDLIRAGSARAVVAGGMESMTNAPYLQKDARRGARLGHTTLHDHMFLDGLQDAYEGHLMGVYAQQIADQCDFSREQMDDWAKMSVQRALAAQQQQAFAEEIMPVRVENRRGVAVYDHDEHPGEIDLNKISTLKPVFAEDGSVTAASSSAISDGAAALLVMSEEAARHYGFTPLAIIRGHATHARKPAEFTVAPVDAIRQLLTNLSWSVDDVDLWEINEAFAVVTQIAVRELGLEADKVNIHGGACALGHPIGASGARILVTLIHALKQQARQGQSMSSGASMSSHASTEVRSLKGVAALCIGGGEATAIAVEVPL
ncbi:thiolase family protein [Photobacterium sp. TY1-4]|uniref:thiolase family protein n=1 Tax=Photobacterium sp. TY1-4 TaxID=2899122 RepID=UPI0021C10E4B|nr:thiolase family protein [Photobacterium sp. TY1-4]UXI04019.1 thiolase family protein [Photobacterium sp. TY1-4]